MLHCPNWEFPMGNSRFLFPLTKTSCNRVALHRLFSILTDRNLTTSRKRHEEVSDTVKQRSKTHKMFSRTLFNQTKPDRMQIFKGIFFFKATNNIKQTNHLAAASCVLPEGCAHKTDVQLKKMIPKECVTKSIAYT